MHTLGKNMLVFAIALSMLAGCIDAIGFMQLGGRFVSFMSGNSTRLAVSLQHGNRHEAGSLAAIIACFVGGAALGAVVRNRIAQHKTAGALTLVVLLLVAAALGDSLGMTSGAMLIIALAMGAENSVLSSNGDHVIGVTYMTGSLVKVGQRIARALEGGEPFSWAPYLLLWLGLIAGGMVGAFLFTACGIHALWVPAIWAACLAALQWKEALKKD